MHALVSSQSVQWLIAAGIFYALSSVFVYGKQVYQMINKETQEDNSDVGIQALQWATMLSYVICTISMLGALITCILDANSTGNYAQQ